MKDVPAIQSPLFLLRTDILPDFPMAAWTTPKKRDPLAINPFGSGYNITNEDLHSPETRSKKLKERDKEDPAGGLGLNIEIVGLLDSFIEELHMNDLRSKFFTMPYAFKPEVAHRLEKLRLYINCMGNLLISEPPKNLELLEFGFNTFYPADTGPLPVNNYGWMNINFRELGIGHPLQIYTKEELTQIRAKFVFDEGGEN